VAANDSDEDEINYRPTSKSAKLLIAFQLQFRDFAVQADNIALFTYP